MRSGKCEEGQVPLEQSFFQLTLLKKHMSKRKTKKAGQVEKAIPNEQTETTSRYPDV